MKNHEIKNKRTLSNVKITKGAILWITGQYETKLYVKPNGSGYDWIMISPKTGSHIIKQNGGLEPILTERVKLHWDGFQLNQIR